MTFDGSNPEFLTCQKNRGSWALARGKRAEGTFFLATLGPLNGDFTRENGLNWAPGHDLKTRIDCPEITGGVLALFQIENLKSRLSQNPSSIEN